MWQAQQDPVPEVKLSHEEADTLMVIHAWHVPRNYVLDAP